MKRYFKYAMMGLCVFSLSSCVVLENSTTDNLFYPVYTPEQRYQLSTQNEYNMINYKYYQTLPKQEVVVPDSYHVGSLHSPVSFHDRDETWVKSQNPQAYTIEIAEGDKAANVARTLYKAPKNDRMAQVKYQREGKDYYRGLYGTFNSAAEAQKALDSLPPEIKRGASVKNWASVQSQ